MGRISLLRDRGAFRQLSDLEPLRGHSDEFVRGAERAKPKYGDCDEIEGEPGQKTEAEIQEHDDGSRRG